MNFEFFFSVQESYLLKVYANKQAYRWESGGAFGSDFSEKQWYEGIISFSKEGAKWYFFFETYEVRDVPIAPLTQQLLFGTMSTGEILDACEKMAQSSEKSPFPFVKIGRDFLEKAS